MEPLDHDAYVKWLIEERKQRGDNWNFKYIQPFTHGHNIGTLQLARINGEEYLGMAGVKCIDMARMSGWATSGKIRHGWSNCQKDSMQRYATPWVASETVEITVDYHATRQVGSMLSRS